jgi:mannitol-1-phosphate 5-dehydrogenase
VKTAPRTFVGFGFGPIQAGLFIDEAHRSGRFDRLVVAEVLPEVVEAVRRAAGLCHVNVATRRGIEHHDVPGVELYDPRVPEDCAALVGAVGQSEEMATALPSVAHYESGEPASVAALLAAGLERNARGPAPHRAVIYAAENHNRAAELLEAAVDRRLEAAAPRVRPAVQYLNTVIGKMSGVVTDERQIAEQQLARAAGDSGRAFLVEEFNRILVSRVRWPDFRRALSVFEEKDDLLPFEEAKLYGHNATHALLGYLAAVRGHGRMADAGADPDLMAFARAAFLEESGAALCRRHAGVDPLFTDDGYRRYADDLLEHMVNPHLRDTVERVTRDPRRKLGWDDRLVGTMRVALRSGIEPRRYAVGAAAALRALEAVESRRGEAMLEELWGPAPGPEQTALRSRILAARVELDRWAPLR